MYSFTGLTGCFCPRTFFLNNELDISSWTCLFIGFHYSDVITGAIASEFTSLRIVYSTAYSGIDQRKHQSPASLAFVRVIHRWRVNSLHKRPVTRKVFPFDDVIKVFPTKHNLHECFMLSSWLPLRCLVLWMDHLPHMWLSTFRLIAWSAGLLGWKGHFNWFNLRLKMFYNSITIRFPIVLLSINENALHCHVS